MDHVVLTCCVGLIFVGWVIASIENKDLDDVDECACIDEYECTRELFVINPKTYNINFTELIAIANISMPSILKVELRSGENKLFNRELYCVDDCGTVSADITLKNPSYEARLITEKGCFCTKYIVNYVGNESKTCEDSMLSNLRIGYNSSNGKMDFFVNCVAENGHFQMTLENELSSNAQVIWYKNCEQIDVANWMADGSNYLEFQVVNTEDTPATYSCEIVTETKRFFIMHRPVCVEERDTDSSTEFTVVGDDANALVGQQSVNLTCSGEIPASRRDYSYVYWYKYPNFEEPICAGSEGVYSNCTITIEDNPMICQPTKVAAPKSTSTFIATYTIRNVCEEDAGKYRCSIEMLAKGIKTGTATLIVPSDLKLSLILGCITAALLVIAICILLINIFWIEVRYYWKKWFVNERPASFDKPYVVYLSYSYDENLKREIHTNVSEVVKALHEQLSRLQYPFYDPSKGEQSADYEIVQVGQPIADSAMQILGRCRSFMMVLTENAVKDKAWLGELTNLLGLTKGAVEDIEIVFLCTPRATKFLNKKAARGEEACVTLKAFMTSQKNFVIKWKVKNMLSARFYKALYVALPKVEKNVIVLNQHIV